MKTFKTYLNPEQRKSKFSPYYYSILGVVYIVLGVMNYLINNYSPFLGLIWVLGGIIFLIGGYFQTNFTSKYYFEINDRSILIKQSLSATKSISLDNIKNIQIKPISIDFLLNDNSKESISLGNVGYKNVLDIKEKLTEIPANKGIAVK
ncbi:MAG: hypothetical protein H6610_10590 [Ignavibacteriales bacterium]|nr:hypothetical protein [Ignavibacteriales bacterium]